MSKNIVSLHTGLRGMYKIEAVKPDGSKRLLADWFPNLITDNGLEQIAVGGYLYYACVGSGNTAPSNSDTALVSFIGAGGIISAARTATSSPPYYGATTIVYRIAAGSATGNLSEVGVGSQTNGLNLFSRALILDGTGTPTTITVLSTEALDVTYQLQLYSPTTDVTGTVNISGVNYNYTMRAALVTNAGYWAPLYYSDAAGYNQVQVGQGTIGAVTSSPTFTASDYPDGLAIQSYGAGNHYIDTICSFSLGRGNVSGGINCFQLFAGRTYQDLGTFQCQLDASIPKDASHTLSLTFRHSWGRYP
ncbi:MAG: hypothetical protein M3O20_01190 [Acidobacteriota bacterium]|nr:hypothetical protein [Acidobacteriota bacterium]